MAETVIQERGQRTEWFESWFDSPHYHRLYRHRNYIEAASFLDRLTSRLGSRRGARVLDLGCGAGRHSIYLASKGLHVTGIDLAAGSIGQAQKSERACLRFCQQDMRVPFGRDVFDYVFNFFTSFGYFDEPDEHLSVVRNICTSLRAGGRLVLDYLNVWYAEARATHEEATEIDGITYLLTRWADARYFFKRIVVKDGAAEPLGYVERVAKFTRKDFACMFAAHNLYIEMMFGDYQLAAYDPATSPRLILVARKGKKDRRSVTSASDACARGSAFPA